MTSVTLHAGDNRESLRRLIDQGVRVHAVVTDPPYGLVSVQKRFGKEGSKAARTDKNDGSFARLSGGFMGKTWDGSGIERDPEFWKLIHDILLPGGYVFAFSGSRTGHWQAVAMELAGFIMHPMHGWVFGSGFPKAHAADKAIDATLLRGSARTTDIRQMQMGEGYEPSGRGRVNYDHGGGSAMNGATGPYTPQTPQAAEWEGWAYGTQAQKPALEPIYLGQKPFSEKTGAANLLKHGVGAVNIDGCRVGYQSADDQASAKPQGKATAKVGALAGKTQNNGERSEFVPDNTKGRHPANLLLDGSPEVVAMFPTTAGARAPVKGTEDSASTKNAYGQYERVPGAFHGDSGSAARFFHQFPLTYEDYELAILAGIIGEDRGDPLIYHGKAGKADRAGTKHPTVKPINLIRNLVRHITPPGGIVLDPFAGSGTTAEAARREGFECVLMEAEPEYIDFLRQRFTLAGATTGFEDLLGEPAPEFEDLL